MLLLPAAPHEQAYYHFQIKQQNKSKKGKENYL
jgi:hypothetical protein